MAVTYMEILISEKNICWSFLFFFLQICRQKAGRGEAAMEYFHGIINDNVVDGENMHTPNRKLK